MAEQMDPQSLLDQKKKSLIEIYFELQQYYEERYGNNTVVVMEVGSFYEVYGVDNDQMRIGKTKEIAELLNLQITRKNKHIAENSVKNPILAGFPLASFDRYIGKLLQENTYTIVIVKQRGIPPKVTRYVDRILSPGIHFEYATAQEENYVASLLVDCVHGQYSIGFAALDITTGKSIVTELHSTKEDKTYALDAAFHLLRSQHTAEILLTCVGKHCTAKDVRQYLELCEHPAVQEQDTRLSVAYQNELFANSYVIQSFLSPIEFLDLERKPLASEALAHLLQFAIEHDHHVVKQLQLPKHIHNTEYVYLGNNPLEQLNIITDNPAELSVHKLIDATVTSIGKRLLKDRLVHPIMNVQELERRYDLVDVFTPLVSPLQKDLRKIYDLERIARRIQLQRLHPFEVNFLYDSLLGTQGIIEQITAQDITALPFFVADQDAIADYIHHIENIFNLSSSSQYTFQDIATNIFQKGFHVELDVLIEELHAQETLLEIIRTRFIELIADKTGKEEDSYVIIRQLDKEGHYIHLTKSRFALIEQEIKKAFVSLDGTVHALADFHYKKQTSNVKVTAKIIDDISKDIVAKQVKIIALVKELFLQELDRLHSKYAPLLERIIDAIGQIDVAVSTAKNVTDLRLVRPRPVAKEDGPAFLDITALRHPLIEQREQHGIYIPNNIVMGTLKDSSDTESVILSTAKEDPRGVLLYGINSSGKSSLMKSLGIAIILAQSGFFVPTETLHFSICSELFTRIIATDNLEKGLSSFAVEMLELKNIFNRCTPHSLVLGDEISHGTETLSALAIISATMLRLLEKESLFFFTTHLHQLQDLPLLKNQHHIVSVHLAVHYDKDADVLLFDRTLQPGSGSRIYGLEFAQSLHMDEAFLQKAMTIREDLAGQMDPLHVLAKKQKRSMYHKDLYITNCQVCNKHVEEVHHIMPQQLADSAGNIGHFHKNHKSNLLPLCEACHDKVHAGTLKVDGYVMTSKGLVLRYEEEENEDNEN